jgi:hypothetical protein
VDNHYPIVAYISILSPSLGVNTHIIHEGICGFAEGNHRKKRDKPYRFPK